MFQVCSGNGAVLNMQEPLISSQHNKKYANLRIHKHSLNLNSMSNDPKLTAKQLLFCKEYLIDLNATQAAIRAGYSEKTATETGYENLTKPHIAEHIQKEMDNRSQKTQINAEYVLETIKKTIERCSQSEPVLVNGQPSGEFKFDAANVLKGAELLGRHLKLFTDKTEVHVISHESALDDLK